MNPALKPVLTITALIPARTRLESIDVLRGLVMIIMALDHTRHLFHSTAFTDSPLNLDTTTPALFFTRWITHFCAPIFVFLSGTSIYLQAQRKSKAELSQFLIVRGLWLIVAEISIVTLGITFNPFYSAFILQVIWAIGASMVMLGLLIHLPFRVIGAIGILLVLGHNLLDASEAAPDFKPSIGWALLHNPGRFPFALNHVLIIDYPVVPWLGLMIVGYCAGIVYGPTVNAGRRRTILIRLGLGLLGLFLALRFSNIYGDPLPWSSQGNELFTLLSFLNVEKYPPSLLYMCITIAPALLFLALIEPLTNRFTALLVTFGRTAFFYYIVHWYLLHTLCLLFFFVRGHGLTDTWQTKKATLFIIPGEGVSLPMIYLIWGLVILIMYRLCLWYDGYKTSHRNLWWLSYV